MLFAAVLSLTARAEASPEDIFGYGARSSAMAGTGAALADDYEAAYTGPALLSRIRAPRLSLGLQGAVFNLHARGEGLPDRVSVIPAKGVIIGVDLPLPFGGALQDRVSGALAFYTPTDVIVRGRILYPETPQFPLLPDRAQSLAIRLGLGANLGYGFRVGAGFAALAEIVGSVLVATDATGRVGSRVEDQLVATYAPIASASYEHAAGPGTLRVGATVRGALDARFAVSIDATKLSSLNIPVFNISGLAQYDPLEIAAEVAWENASWHLAAGFTVKHWSAYPGAIEPTILCPTDTPDCGALQPTHLAFHDTVVPRAAVERTLPLSKDASLSLRGGYFFEPTPAPAQLPTSFAYDLGARDLVPVPTRFFDASRHVLTAGLGVHLARPLRLSVDAYAQLHVLHPRTVTLESTTPAAATTGELGGTVLATGLVVGVGF